MAAKVKIPYYSVRRGGRGFWEPRPHMRALGFYSVPCGKDGPEAWAIAEQWNARWQRSGAVRRPPPPWLRRNNLSPETSEELTVYPPRSLGEAFRRYRRTEEWATKTPRTREDWWRCWRRIKPVFGDVNPRTVTLENISAWRKAIEETDLAARGAPLPENLACALEGCGRARLLRARCGSRRLACAIGRHLAAICSGPKARWYASPSAPGAWDTHGLAAVIAVAWDTQLSPGDVRALRASQLARGAAGEAFLHRAGQDRQAGRRNPHPALPGSAIGLPRKARASSCTATRTSSAIDLARPTRATRSVMISATCAASSSAALSGAPSDMISAAPVQSRRSPAAPRPRQVAHAMGNTLSASNALFATYVPVNVSDIARRDGGAAARPQANCGESTGTERDQKVGTRRPEKSERRLMHCKLSA